MKKNLKVFRILNYNHQKMSISILFAILFTATNSHAFLWSDPKQNCTEKVVNNYCYSPPGPMLNMDSYPFQWSSCGVPGTFALTIDDGPSNHTSAFLDVLKQYGMRATFFLIGRHMIDIDHTIVQRIADEGHQIGSHTQDHMLLTNLTSDQIDAQILNWERTFTAYNYTGSLANSVIPNYFRAPHGAVNETVYGFLSGYGYTIMNWGWNIEDTSGENLSPQELFEVYISHLGDGGSFN